MRKLLAIIAVLAAILAGLFLYVDRRVVRYLSLRDFKLLPAIYSTPYELATGFKLTPEQLSTKLINRRYLQVSHEPGVPGEFEVSGDLIRLRSREFIGPDGRTQPSLSLALETNVGKISSEGQPVDAVLLEPEVISLLGSEDVRASSQKSLSEIPKSLQHALIAIEDERFYDHWGIDLLGLLRALVTNLRSLSIVQGGSTITQQLAKNLFFSPKRTISRKILEALAAISLERRMSKDQILEAYLNEVYFGQEGAVAIHGANEASKYFFGKKVEDLSLAEAALLAGIIKAPSYYSPKKHYKRALERKNTVLDKMAELKFVTPGELKSAKAAKVEILKVTTHSRQAAHFVQALKKELQSDLDLESAVAAGVAVYSGINGDMQRCAERAVSEGIARLERDHPALRRRKEKLEGALVAIEPFSGQIRSWVGSRSYGTSQFDHVNQALRQVGSTIKPFLYLTALDRSLNQYKVATTMSILSDEPMEIKLVTRQEWVPENYDREFRGDVTLRYALENSLNMPAVYTSQRVGIESFAKVIKSFELADTVPIVPALALGAVDTTLLKLTSAYGALANGGIYVQPRLFVSALDNQGEPLLKSSISEKRVANEDAVYVLTNIMQGVIERGTGKSIRALGFSRPAAGKTGTSNDTRDGWFVGFTPNLVAGVWIGFDDNSKVGLTGGGAAAPIWAEFMKCSSPDLEPLDFIPPPGVTFVYIDRESGGLATSNCPDSSLTREVFVRGTEPTRQCPLHSGTSRIVPERAEEQDTHRQERSKTRKRERSFWDILFG